MPTPWRNGIQLTNNWRCQCNRIVSNRLTCCDVCGVDRAQSSEKCQCGCRWFVWWIADQKVFSGPTLFSFLSSHLRDNPRCVKCNRGLSD